MIESVLTSATAATIGYGVGKCLPDKPAPQILGGIAAGAIAAQIASPLLITGAAKAVVATASVVAAGAIVGGAVAVLANALSSDVKVDYSDPHYNGMLRSACRNPKLLQMIT